MADRIMEAADAYADQFTEEGAEFHRAVLAARVARACAPQPERVCRWMYRSGRDDWYEQGCGGDEYGYIPGAFCPECGGRIERSPMPDAPAFYHTMTKRGPAGLDAMVACTRWVSVEGLERIGWATRHVCRSYAEAEAAKARLLDAEVGITPEGII